MNPLVSTTTATDLPFQAVHQPLAFVATSLAQRHGRGCSPISTTPACTPESLEGSRRSKLRLPSHFQSRHVFQRYCNNRVKRSADARPTCLFAFEYEDDSAPFDDYEEADDDMVDLIQRDADLSKLDSLEDLLIDLENDLESFLDDEENEELDDDDFEDEDVETLLSLLADDDYDEDDDESDLQQVSDGILNPTSSLEDALLQGVVPVSAGVGSECLPGDWGFDPLNLASKDYILQAQYSLLQALPGAEKQDPPPPRPSALILRDYREAEIRHGRIAMIAAVIWPLQEMLDKLLLDDDQVGPLIYGPVTLPYFPLLMTLVMMLLGYLDIYAKAIQEKDDIGDAFLPGDCFWDPLKMLEGAPASMKRNMQERELFNGRVAMLAFAAYVFEEATTRVPLISIDGNELLFVPAYQVPYIQEFLDRQFS